MKKTLFKSTKKLAEAGDAEAQYELGYMYYEGIYVDKDNIEAIKWYMLAAEQGHADAQTRLDDIYDKANFIKRGLNANVDYNT